MRYKLLLWIGCIYMTLSWGCVSKTQFDTVSNDLLIAQEQITEGDTKRDELDRALKDSKKETHRCRNENNLLSQQVEALNQTTRKQETVISLQMTVIRLFDDSKQTLQTSIQEQIASEDLETSTAPPPSKFVLVNKLLFQSGSAELTDEGKQLLKKLTGLLEEKRYAHIQVRGHTDDRLLKSTSRYANNWELSLARAMVVVQFLHETVGIEPERMSASGFGQYHPIAPNDSAEGRKQNRRIEIILETSI